MDQNNYSFSLLCSFIEKFCPTIKLDLKHRGEEEEERRERHTHTEE